MKRTFLAALLAGLSASAHGQGEILFANFDNTSTSPTATSNGLFWLSTNGNPVLINQDFNAALYAGTDPNRLALFTTLLLSDGTALGDNSAGPGTIYDMSGNFYFVPGARFSAFFVIQAWTGDFNSYAAAVAGGAPAVQSPVFSNRLSSPFVPLATLEGMPAIVLSIPEPRTIVLAGFGAVALLIWRRR